MTTASGLVVRAPDAHELEAFTACIETAFAMRLPAEERERFIENLDTSCCLAAFADGELVGTLANRPLEITLPGGVLQPVSAVTEATVLPTYRRRGALRAMLDSYFSRLKVDGPAISMLSASEGTIYGRFGYGPSIFGCDYLIERDQSGLRPVPASKGSVRLLSFSELSEVLPAVHDAARRLRPGELNRPEDWWGELVREVSRTNDPRYVACYEEQGEIAGYVVYEISRYDHRARELVVQELVSTSDEAYRALWAYVLGVDLVSRVRTRQLPVDEALRHLLEDPRALQVTRHLDRSWTRLVGLEPALSARRYGGAGSLVLEVLDEVCPWNSGVYELASDEHGVASCTRSAARPQLRLRAAELGACYLGGTRAVGLWRAGQVEQLEPSAVARFDALFASFVPPYCVALE